MGPVLVVGRTDPDPRLLKPHPHLVLRALDALGGDPTICAFVGDSTSDVQSAKAAGTQSVGYANKPGECKSLQHAGADVIVNQHGRAARRPACSPAVILLALPGTSWQAALAAGASFSHHAQGGGIWPETVLACPTPSRKHSTNQPGT